MFSKLIKLIRVFTILCYVFVNVACNNDENKDITRQNDIKLDKEKVLPFQDVVSQNMQFSKVTNICMRRIAGGEVAPAQYVPYQVAIKQHFMHYWITYCGGSLVTYDYVLTSAHCFCGSDGKMIKNLESLRIVAGGIKSVTTDQLMVFEQSRKLKNFWRHQEYDLDRYKHDIGVVLVESRFFPAPGIKPVPMKRPKDTNHTIGGSCVIAGFGVREYEVISNELRLVCLPLKSNDECKHYYGEYVTDEIVCAGVKGKDSCTGDSGGALVCDGIQFGIMTFGSLCGEYPGMYTNVETYTTRNDIFMNWVPTTPRNLYFATVLPCLYQYYFYYIY